MYSELGLSQELVDLRVREDMGEEVYVLKHSHSSQQCPGEAGIVMGSLNYPKYS